MKYCIKILRGSAQETCWQSFFYEGDGSESVAGALDRLNSREELRDCDGMAAEKIEWECACFEKKCGACAMVIGGRPALACSVRLREAADGAGLITLEPLKKFPRIRDLRVDRESMQAHLKEMELWLETEAELCDKERRELHYRAAGCLMCGLCLEVCPNFSPRSDFYGAMSAVAAYRAVESSEKGDHRKNMRRGYVRHFYNGCSKSLSCQDICPMKIPVEQLLVKTNAAAIWNRGARKK